MSCLPTGEYFITFHASSQHLNPVDALTSIGRFSRAFWQSTSVLVCDNPLSSLRVAAAVPEQYLISVYILRC